MQSKYHKGVLIREVIDLLQIKVGKKYIDATLGGGGHAIEIIKRGGKVLGIDTDLESIDYIKKTFRSQISDLKLIPAQGNFKDIDKIAHSHGFERVDGIIFDLGVSSHQLEEGDRGFSFQREGPLDMRMDQSAQTLTAADILNLAGKDELYEIFIKFGQEPRARLLASAILRARKIKAIKTTGDLLKVIEGVYGLKQEISDKTKASIGKRVFQALRITVNAELENLDEALPKALSLLEANGRLEVISFHSLEDRIVKQNFLNFEKKGLGRIATGKPILPSPEEQKINRRSRSAKLRVFEKLN